MVIQSYHHIHNIVILRFLLVCRELFGLLDYDGGGTVGVEEFCEGVLKAGASAPVPTWPSLRKPMSLIHAHY